MAIRTITGFPSLQAAEAFAAGVSFVNDDYAQVQEVGDDCVLIYDDDIAEDEEVDYRLYIP